MIVDEESPGRLAVRSSAKLNLFLEVLGRRADGYHEIETVFQEIGVHDRLEFERADDLPPGTVRFSCEPAGLAHPGENLVERAAAAFLAEARIPASVRIRLRKGVPAGSGLGGGSSDAATTLLALGRLLGADLPWERARALAGALGADCAFFLKGGAAVGRGRGEVLDPLRLPSFVYLVVVPPVHCATAEIYAALAARRAASLNGPTDRRTIPPRPTLSGIDRAQLDRMAFNRLREAAFERVPQLSRIADVIQRICERPVHMTGSGSGLFTICDDLASAESLSWACRGSRELRAAAEPAPENTTIHTFVAESLPERPYPPPRHRG